MKDVERPCRKSGCKRTWTDKRGAQLARLVRGKTGDPYPQYCNECRKELGDLEDREISCKTDGCPGTWTWSREQQLAAGVRPSPKAVPSPGPSGRVGSGCRLRRRWRPSRTRPRRQQESRPDEAPAAPAAPVVEIVAGQVAVPVAGKGGGRRDKRNRRQRQIHPPERLCHACGEFLKDRKTLEIPCSQCGTSIYWPPESQLQSHLGNWATPSLCGACKRDATEAARRAAKEILRQQVIDASGVGDPAAPETPPAPAEPATAEPLVGENTVVSLALRDRRLITDDRLPDASCETVIPPRFTGYSVAASIPARRRASG